MAAVLAIVAAVCFALAAVLQQKGEFKLAERGKRVTGVRSLIRLILVPVWLLGTAILFVGYATQGGALARGRLVVIQPLLVMAIVFALPLGHWLTGQHVTRRQVWGAIAVVIGLSLFVLVGDPNQGLKQPKSNWEYLAASIVVSAAAGLLIWGGSKAKLTMRAALLGCAVGLWSALSATFSKETIDQLHQGLVVVLSHPEVYGLIGFGVLAFVVQQLALATGQLAPALATGSVSNPFASVLLGVVLLDERMKRPAWHVVVGVVALLFALYGAVLITMGHREREMPSGAHTQDDISRKDTAGHTSGEQTADRTSPTHGLAARAPKGKRRPRRGSATASQPQRSEPQPRAAGRDPASS